MGDTKDFSAHGIPQFRGEGFDDWQFRVKMLLESIDVGVVLTGDPPTDAVKREEFLKKDKRAMERLVSFVHNDCLSYVRDKETAKEMWNSLKEAFASKSVVSQVLIRKQLATLRMQESDSVVAHLATFENLVQQLKLSGTVMEESDMLAQLFLSLPEKFDPLVTALQNIEDGKLKFNMVKVRLIAEETKFSDRRIGDVKVNTAFSGKKKFKKSVKFQGKCFRCQSFGHKAKDCRNGNANSAKSNPGNNAKVCFMANGEAHERCGRKLTFKLDSGASDHIVNTKDCFDQIRKLPFPEIIHVAKNSESIIAHENGEISGISNTDVPIMLMNVLYIPELRDNLLSVRKLTKAGLDVQFSKSMAVIKQEGKTIATASLKGNLYEFIMDINKDHSHGNAYVASEIELWHKRLGHIGENALNELVKRNLVNGVTEKSAKIKFCDTCIEAKHCRDPFKGTHQVAKRVLERVHSDVCGPISPTGHDGSKYFVSFIDEYSHFAMIYLIKRKSQVFEAFKEYEALVVAKFGVAISQFTSDQGREYCSTEQLQWYKKKGIQIETTIAYSPQQNGVAERFNRTLVEKVRAMIIESNVPKNMWGDAAQCACYLINRSPTKSLDGHVTPAEKFYGEKPDLMKLRVFGCKAMAWIPNQKRGKLDSKSKKSVMIGYVPNGYKLWDMEKRKVFTSRDVKFEEAVYPFKERDHGVKSQLTITTHEQEGDNSNVVCARESITIEDNNVPEATDEIDVQAVESQENEDDEFEDSSENPGLKENQDYSQKDSDQRNALPERNQDTDITLRRSQRERNLPGKFIDFFTSYSADASSNFITDVPENFKDIFGRSDEDKWLKSIDEELQSMKENNVWKIVDLPKGAKQLNSKWVFRIKLDENGNPARYKARLVAKGFMQKQGIDYNETYSPVAKLTTIRVVLAVAVRHKYHLHQLDVKTAFLHGLLEEKIYMSLPDGVEKQKGKVCQLVKSLYGLKQSPRCWNHEFNKFIVNLGFMRSKHDYCLYVKKGNSSNILILVLYVDDLLIAGNQLSEVEELKKDLGKRFEMSDCGQLKSFLGMKIENSIKGLKLSQEASIERVLQKFGMTDCNSVKTPMEKGIQLNPKTDTEFFEEPYRELLGSLMYIMLCVRPDICFAVGYMGRFQQNPSDQHWQALKRILRYLQGTKSKKLNFTCTDDEPLIGYADADWGNDLLDRKSISGYVFKVFGCTVSWSSKKQTTVSISSSEAEYIALSLD